MAPQVLVPMDSSEHAQGALEYALEAHPEAAVTALHVLDPGDFYAATGMEGEVMTNYEQLRASHEERGQEILDRAVETAAEVGRSIETDQVVGGVARSIVSYAEETGVDHVVVGSHGRTGASRILLGSVAETVARRSPVPVTIVR